MNTKVAFLHLIILTSQAICMYLSNKAQMKNKWYLYLISLPVVLAYPVVLNAQNPDAYSIYEYTIVIYAITAFVVDVTYAFAWFYLSCYRRKMQPEMDAHQHE